MKKLITKYWGLVLVVVLLCSLFVVGAPASAANYAWATSAMVPTIVSGSLAAAGFGVTGVAQSGSTIYAIANTGGGSLNSLYKSADGGATWRAQTTGITNVAGANTWGLVATAPDDPNVVLVVDTQTMVTWISITGGTLFSALPAAGTVTTITSITVSPLTTARYIVLGGNAGGTGGVASWTMGLTSPSWTSLAPPTGATTNVKAVQFSPSFSADTGLLVITNNVTAGVATLQAHVYSYNIAGLVPANGWNTNGMFFPRTIYTGSNSNDAAIAKVSLALDANFYLGDLSVQNGFIGVTDTNNLTYGGIYRFDPAGTITQIYGGATSTSQKSIWSVAWDGTNLMAGPYVAAAGASISILRCANALTSLPTVIPSTTVKTPGTGTAPIVIFNGGVGYAFSQGANSGVAKTTDLGKTFNAFALVNSNFNTISDFWVSADGTRKYIVTDDGVDINLWSYNGAWSRIMVLAAGVGQTWLVRGDVDVPDTIFIAQKGATLMYKSTDGGASWTIRGASSALADFAVQDANTVFALSNANGNVYKSITGGFTWTAIPVLYLGGNGYSITLLKHNSVLVGTTTGGVAYSNDGAAFTSIFPTAPVDALTAGNTVVTGTGTAAGDTIFAATSAGMLGKWVIGTSTAWGVVAGSTFAPAGASFTGIGYASGILYAINDTANITYRWITPTSYGVKAAFLSDSLPMSATSVTDQTVIVNSLTMAGNVLYARDRDATVTTIDDIITYSDLLLGAAGVPTPTYPINNVIIPVNSLSGAVNPFNFMWNVPSAAAPLPNGYSFNVQVYLDAAGTIPFAGNTVTAVAPFSFTTGVVAAANLGGTPFTGTPGVTYYWRVRTASLFPELGAWSAMMSFNVQQLQAIVPVLSAPVNGSYLPAGQAPSFSWNPIAGATSYNFQLSTDPSFATTVYAATATSAGIALPATVTPLKPGTTYYWRVSTLTPAQGEWSTVANFTVSAPVTTAAPTSVAPAVTPTITVNIPAATTTVITIPPAVTQTTEVNPSYIWAIIIIGAVLVIAVIVLIVRTRRSV
jgi:hypothetical protein